MDFLFRWTARISLAAVLACGAGFSATADRDSDDAPTSQLLPTGQRITPTAATGALFQELDPGLQGHPDFRAGQAVTTVASHDGKTLLILTSGFNKLADQAGKPDTAASNEYVFVFDIQSRGPRKMQVVPVPNTDSGIAFATDDSRFYVSGGVDDNLHIYAKSHDRWVEDGEPISLGHKSGLGIIVKPSAAGLAVTADGSKVVIADRQNDAITIIDPKARKVIAELDLRPGKNDPAEHGVAGGEYPDWVAIKGNDTAFISSQRDREVVEVNIAQSPRVVARVPITGTPNRMVLNADESKLYVAADNSDLVTVIDTASAGVRETFSVAAPPGTFANAQRFKGVAPNSLAISPDGGTLYVTDGGDNALAIVRLGGSAPHYVAGLVPTAWYPNSVTAVGDMVYVVNGRSDPGPNPTGCYHPNPDKAKTAACDARNRYILQLSHAGFLSFPAPGADDLKTLTDNVAANNGFKTKRDPADEKMMAALQQRIKHVVYIVKENRTYDQVLGDLDRGNGDPSLALFGKTVTPNAHALAKKFVTLDNFMDSGDVSGNGWPWSTEARETDVGVKSIPLQYAGRGQSYDVEGMDRNINVALPTTVARRAADPISPEDPDQLPGTGDVGATDSTSGEVGRGHLWDAALSAGLTVRNYGYYCDLARYQTRHPDTIPLDREPFKSKTVMAYSADAALMNRTDPYFRSFDTKYPDFYREREWAREFGQYVAHKNLPNLLLVRFMEDHTGEFANAIDGVDTPEAQVADNDYAVGQLVEAISKSPYKDSTLIVVIEDDAQDGPDHVDPHRSVAFFAGPYVKQAALISTRYSTVNILRTIEDVLGIEPLSLNDAYQRPMTDVFDLKQKNWTFTAEPSPALLATKLPIAHKAADAGATRFAFSHDARYWARETKGYDWSQEDRIDSADYNRVLWTGLAGAKPYPAIRDGKNLRTQRPKDD